MVVFRMKRCAISRLLLALLIATLINSCSNDSGVPGGQAATKSLGQGETPQREPVEILVDGKALRLLSWKALDGLSEDRFGTGMEDFQVGYPLIDVIAHLGIESAQAVTLYGVGIKPVTLSWEEIMERDNQVILGLTHKGTLKVVAGNPRILNRDGWVRHVVKMDIHKETAPALQHGRKAEPETNPLHPRKKRRGTE